MLPPRKLWAGVLNFIYMSVKNNLSEEDQNLELVALLLIADIPKTEKAVWLQVLSTLSQEQKKQLKLDLEEQVNAQGDAEVKAAEKFAASLNK